MSGGIEAGADIASGALLGRAVEPTAGEAHGAAHGACLNCGTALIGPHCHACGQAGHVHRTMGAIGHEIAHGVFHFDGKMWRTLPLLVLKPGELTRRYVHGERARFVSPLAIFLFTVFLMFTVVANLPGWSVGESDLLKPGVAAKMMETRTALADEQARLDGVIGQARGKLAKEQASATPDAERIAELRQKIAKATEDRTAAATIARTMTAPTLTTKLPVSTEDDFATGSPSSDNWFEAKWRHAQENPKLILYKIKTSAYKFSWALIPLSLPFIWLLFPFRRDVGMYDHAVFATYSLTFMSLLVIALALLGAIGVPTAPLVLAAIALPPFHMYRQLKDAYRLSRGGALWRLFWLLNFALVVAVLFVLLLLYLGVAD